MPCPECGAEDRLCVKNGHIFRKLTVPIEGKRGAKVNRYLCTNPDCGYTGRGKFFNLPEFDPEGEEKKTIRKEKKMQSRRRKKEERNRNGVAI